MDKNEGYLAPPKGFATKAIHAFQEPDQWNSRAIVAPLTTSTTYKQDGPAEYKQFDYSRSGNPNRLILEKILASLENAEYGLCFASGLGAMTAVCGLFNSGDHIVCEDDVYGGTNRLLQRVISKMGIETTFVDTKDAEKVEKAIRPNTKMLWIETPTNPTLKVIDIRAMSAVARKHNILLAVDNTFLTPYFQRPMDLGADMVVHSISKYINGHSDVIMGIVIVKSKELYEKLQFLQNAMGIVPAPFDCYQVTRGVKTLAVRMQQHFKNCVAVGKFLESHPKAENVRCPALPSHPQHELSKSQTSGYSGMVVFCIKDGTADDCRRFFKALKVFTLAESLGGYESLAELPALMTHGSVPPEQRKSLGITDNFVRLSVGIEDEEDLIEDLRQALEQV